MPVAKRILIVVQMLATTLVIALAYTTLHEGGHALTGLAFGGKITAFNVNFFNLDAHVGMDGQFTTPQNAIINVAGVSLPLLFWGILLLALPKKSGFAIFWIKIVATMGFLNTLLAWIILPFFYINGSAPASDDVTKFIINSGLPPLAVAFGALTIYILGWGLFARRIGNLREMFGQWRGEAKPLSWPWKVGIALFLLGLGTGTVFLLAGSVSGNASGQPPRSYELASEIRLSERDYTSESVVSFTLDEPAEVGIFLRVENINTKRIDVQFIPAQGEPTLLLHGEDFSADFSWNQTMLSLPAGDYQIVLTSQAAPGVLKLWLSGNE